MPPRDVLGVRAGASAEEIAHAFRRFALRHHPDRGGDPARFQAGLDAYRHLTTDRTPAGAASRRADVVFHRRPRARARVPSLLRVARRRLSTSLRP